MVNLSEDAGLTIFGFQHDHGVGSRSLHMVLSISNCAHLPASQISMKNENPHLNLAVNCDNLDLQKRYLKDFIPGIIGHPNVASALLVASGCEKLPVRKIVSEVLNRNNALEFIVAAECNKMNVTVMFGEAALSELSARAIPGFNHFVGSKIGIIHHGRQNFIDKLTERISSLGMEIELCDSKKDDDTVITDLTLKGCILIINFLAENEFPSSSVIAPTITIASGSDYHRSLSQLCDLGPNTSLEEIFTTVKNTLSRQKTRGENLNFFAPLILSSQLGEKIV